MFEIKGLKEAQRQLEDLQKRAQELDGKHSVSMAEVLTGSFLSKHTKFSSLNEMFGASGFKVESQEDFAAIPDDKWDEFIRSISSFDSWKSMLSAASQEWAIKKMGLG